MACHVLRDLPPLHREASYHFQRAQRDNHKGPEAVGSIQKLSLSGSKLDDDPAGSGEGGVPLREIVS